MATPHMAGLNEKQTEQGGGGAEVEQKEGGTDYWQCRLGLGWNSAHARASLAHGG